MQDLVIYILLRWLVSGSSGTRTAVSSTRRFASYLRGSCSLHTDCARRRKKMTSGNVIVQWDFSLTREQCLSYVIYILDTHTQIVHMPCWGASEKWLVGMPYQAFPDEKCDLPRKSALLITYEYNTIVIKTTLISEALESKEVAERKCL